MLHAYEQKPDDPSVLDVSSFVKVLQGTREGDKAEDGRGRGTRKRRRGSSRLGGGAGCGRRDVEAEDSQLPRGIVKVGYKMQSLAVLELSRGTAILVV